MGRFNNITFSQDLTSRSGFIIVININILDEIIGHFGLFDFIRETHVILRLYQMIGNQFTSSAYCIRLTFTKIFDSTMNIFEVKRRARSLNTLKNVFTEF
jgi:hypothetical protein